MLAGSLLVSRPGFKIGFTGVAVTLQQHCPCTPLSAPPDYTASLPAMYVGSRDSSQNRHKLMYLPNQTGELQEAPVTLAL